jgi:hypothetical protein
MYLSNKRGGDWKFAPSNKGDCPRNGVPLWVVVDPLMWGQPWSARGRFAEEVVGMPEVWDYLLVMRSRENLK